nr:hypothetical protein [Yersinia bercovieri]
MLQQNRNAGELQLTATELACAREILESHKQSKDPGPMYNYLASKGDRYAVLANGVVRGDSLAGAMAIYYMERTAADHNKPLTEDQIKDIRFDMAGEYIDVLKNRLDISTGTIYGDINHREAGEFHNKVFDKHGLPPETWTLEPVFNAIQETSRPIYWQHVLNAAGKPAKELKLSFETYNMMAQSSMFSPEAIRKTSRRWFSIIDSPSGYWALGKTATNQLFSADDETSIVIPQCNIEIEINPTPQATRVLPMKISYSEM